MISSQTISLLIDAGLSGETLKQITAAIESDVENACDLLRSVTRNTVTSSDAGSVTPAALRMRKMRKIKRILEHEAAHEQAVTERNAVTSQPVTSDNILSSKEVLRKEEIKKERKAVKRNIYSEEFEKFWSAFPTDPGMSKAETLKSWGKLSPEDQGHAVAAIPAFKAWVTKQGSSYRTVHACRYLSQRRFDGFHEVKATQAAPKQAFVEEGSTAFDDWTRHNGKRPPVIQVQRNGRLVSGWYFPTEYPPTSQSRKDAA